MKNIMRDLDVYDEDALDEFEERENHKPSGWSDKRYRKGDYRNARRKRQQERDALEKEWARERE